jgi:hypothetical protein
MMTEFLHEVVKKRERDEEYRTLMIEPPILRVPSGLLDAISRDMERQYRLMAEQAERNNG